MSDAVGISDAPAGGTPRSGRGLRAQNSTVSGDAGARAAHPGAFLMGGPAGVDAPFLLTCRIDFRLETEPFLLVNGGKAFFEHHVDHLVSYPS
ncbi:hypothetical protein SAMN05421595_2230 [Austwickia chelonae]|uniref:Uncharacterized protein n=1 Tax=Austwickia chelonae NBRC 105200 TaxID=1184607 RepID=K6VP06_9MICO|nr:hypothetical protein AUCHE_04_01310 [Austwickia chelonae NBRC 105200]SEW33907.1 hypothetical protein SAMN05421595_2230 [Austwickia chelonae]